MLVEVFFWVMSAYSKWYNPGGGVLKGSRENYVPPWLALCYLQDADTLSVT